MRAGVIWTLLVVQIVVWALLGYALIRMLLTCG